VSRVCVCVCVCVCVYHVYIYIYYVCVCVCVCVYTYIYMVSRLVTLDTIRDQEGRREGEEVESEQARETAFC
jgi:hypothetical protein